tara:strand:- start:3395 stop:3775 length:381 start_codon:yes stop_codon:yes gene_type:complete
MATFSGLGHTAGLDTALDEDTEFYWDDFMRIPPDKRKPAEPNEISTTEDERTGRTRIVLLKMPNGRAKKMYATPEFIDRWHEVYKYGFPLEIFDGFWRVNGNPGETTNGDKWATQVSEDGIRAYQK